MLNSVKLKLYANEVNIFLAPRFDHLSDAYFCVLGVGNASDLFLIM